MAERKERYIGEYLLKHTALSPEQLARGLEIQKEEREKGRDKRIGDILVRLRYITEEDLLKGMSYMLGIPYVDDINPNKIDPELIRKIPINFAKKNEFIPLKLENQLLTVAIANPANHAPLDDLRVIFGSVDIKPVISTSNLIIGAINALYDREADAADQLLEGFEEDNLDGITQELTEEPLDLLDASDEAPIIRLVNSVLFQAVKEHASDIHIEPFERELSVRFRIDGILYDIISPPKRLQSSISSRVKIMAGLDIAEKRLPQDGRIKIKIAGKDIDLRVSTIPIAHGERIVMRILDRSTVLIDLDSLGFTKEKLALINRLIIKSHGILLVTGPTGSGKTTTLYACLNKINSSTMNIMTVEDPIEYQLHGVGQIQVNPKIELTFASGLRSILRQDPDVVMIGEIRDRETADIAIQASLTGHLVFSTLHTNDAPSAITRLTDMGVEPFLISSSVIGILAQRLLRKVCKHCRIKKPLTELELKELGLSRYNLAGRMAYKAQGCTNCMDTGYSGRTGIYELLLLDDEIRSMIVERKDASVIKRIATQKGMATLREDGARKVLEGKTTVEEVLRVTQIDTTFEG